MFETESRKLIWCKIKLSNTCVPYEYLLKSRPFRKKNYELYIHKRLFKKHYYNNGCIKYHRSGSWTIWYRTGSYPYVCLFVCHVLSGRVHICICSVAWFFFLMENNLTRIPTGYITCCFKLYTTVIVSLKHNTTPPYTHKLHFELIRHVSCETSKWAYSFYLNTLVPK